MFHRVGVKEFISERFMQQDYGVSDRESICAFAT